MLTNDIKKGDRVLLRNGFEAIVLDNKKGNIRFCKVEGICVEMGSVYAHDMMEVRVKGESDLKWRDVDHTMPQQILRAKLRAGTFGV